jgi:hypothetical protein
MTKPRHKDAIRAAAHAKVRDLMNHQPQAELSPPDWRTVFFEALGSGHSITASARMAGVSRDKVYAHKRQKPFRDAWDQALVEAYTPYIQWPRSGTICGVRPKSLQR